MQDRYVLILSRDPFDGAAAPRCAELARSLAGAGQRVPLFLAQTGVRGPGAGARPAALEGLGAQGIAVQADEFSLRERGIAPTRLAKGIEVAPLDAVIDALAGGAKLLWHA